jgi:CRISPR-associated endonuclease/helicase Cas3
MTKFGYIDFFERATSHLPYGYQRRLASGDAGTTCQPKLINIPNGLGKTAAVILAWLWNHVHPQKTERTWRFVCCLPMRTFMMQSEGEVKKWLNAQNLFWDGNTKNR